MDRTTLLNEIKTNVRTLNDTMNRTVEAAVGNPHLDELALQELRHTTECFVGAAEQLERGANFGLEKKAG